MKKENIKIDSHIGTWYIIDEATINGQKFYLLEHEEYGDEAPCIIIDENYLIIADDVYDDWFDVLEDVL